MAKNFAVLQRDDNMVPMMTGSTFLTVDSSGTPKASPLAYSSSEIAITVPVNAAEFVVQPSTAMQISEVTGMANYYVVPASTIQAFCVSRMDTVYIKRNASDGTLNFYFVTV